MANGTVNGKPFTTNEHEDPQQRELEQQEQVQEQAQALALKLAQEKIAEKSVDQNA